MLDLPKTADVVGNSLIFYDSRYALAQCDLHPEQDHHANPTDSAVEVLADDSEGDVGEYFRLRPETLRIFDEGEFPERGANQIYFDRDAERQFILDDFPAMKAEVDRRAYLRAVDRWERHPAQTDDSKELPEFPIWEPARALYDSWQAAAAESRANSWRDFAKVEVAAAAYFDTRPKKKAARGASSAVVA